MAVQTMMGPILQQEWSSKTTEKQDTAKGTSRWADGLCSHPPFEKYLEWPRSLQRRARDFSLWETVLEPGRPMRVATLNEADAKRKRLEKHYAQADSLVGDLGFKKSTRQMSESARSSTQQK